VNAGSVAAPNRRGMAGGVAEGVQIYRWVDECGTNSAGQGRRADHPMELISVTVGVVSLLIVRDSLPIFFSWWPPEADAFGTGCAKAEPEVVLHNQFLRGPGGTSLVEPAKPWHRCGVRSCLYLPDIDGPAWRTAELTARCTPMLRLTIRIHLPVTPPYDGLRRPGYWWAVWCTMTGMAGSSPRRYL